jgi:hypothetical protein
LAIVWHMLTTNTPFHRVPHPRSDRPGAQGGGLLMTMLLGVVGALLGGWLGSVLFDVDLGGFFEIRTWLIASSGRFSCW